MLPRRAFNAGDMSLSMTFDTNSSCSTDQREHTRRKCHTDSTSCALSHPGHSHLRSATATPLQRPFASARQQMPVRRRQRARFTCQSGCSPEVLLVPQLVRTDALVRSQHWLCRTRRLLGLSAVDQLFRGSPANVACVSAAVARSCSLGGRRLQARARARVASPRALLAKFRRCRARHAARSAPVIAREAHREPRRPVDCRISFTRATSE
jgi:hypothetical protein